MRQLNKFQVWFENKLYHSNNFDYIPHRLAQHNFGSGRVSHHRRAQGMVSAHRDTRWAQRHWYRRRSAWTTCAWHRRCRLVSKRTASNRCRTAAPSHYLFRLKYGGAVAVWPKYAIVICLWICRNLWYIFWCFDAFSERMFLHVEKKSKCVPVMCNTNSPPRCSQLFLPVGASATNKNMNMMDNDCTSEDPCAKLPYVCPPSERRAKKSMLPNI